MAESSSSTTYTTRVALFACTTFVSAFLLFQVQPLISKFILPWFGGSPAVWSTCMLFFQVTLFAGYVYAHLTSHYLQARTQALLHVGLLVAAALLLPIAPDETWKPEGASNPVFRIIGLLATCVGLPYFILSSTGPLLQKWFSLQAPGVSPYRLYALSNAGSLLALVSYPFAVEPMAGSPAQAVGWSIAFGFFAVLCAGCAFGLLRRGNSDPSAVCERAESTGSASKSDRLKWFGLASVPSVMLLATTNQVCMDVATVPFLWIVPLTIYLASFILCFDSDRWYRREVYAAGLLISMLFVVWTMAHGTSFPIVAQIAIYFVAFYFCCMVCHGELAARKPATGQLTQFYLLMSAGGAAGGILVGLIAPFVFPAFWELHLGVIACIAIAIATAWHSRQRQQPTPMLLVYPATFLWAVVSLFAGARADLRDAVDVSRNFYGVLRVEETLADDGTVLRRDMFHGHIRHGAQFVAQDKRRIATTYYGEHSGPGVTLKHHRTSEPRHIGVVGLGAGTLATYGTERDRMRFYEINPDVIRMAESHFTFLSDSEAKCEMVLGDARLSLEHEESQDFDVLVLDAFSGDAVPTHLLTEEAFALYERHLADDGILCIHISNMHFDLRPIVNGLAERFSFQTLGVTAEDNAEQGTCATDWVLLSKEPIPTAIRTAAQGTFPMRTRSIVWTDEWSNLLLILR